MRAASPMNDQSCGTGIPLTNTVPAESIEFQAERAEALATHHRLVIFLLLISVFVMIFNETIMGVALPALTRELGITPSLRGRV